MKGKRQAVGRSRNDPPDTQVAGKMRRRASRPWGRWRALSLSLVYVLMAAHIAHWKLTGRTMAPLELNEVMYTLELGIITAGFLFMVALVLGTLVFGRFFCSWACHIIALQDLCAWLLRKLGLARKPIRSRLLLFVPPLTALYMFVWPQLVRSWNHKAFPTFRLAGDAEGWASFVTNNFWRNLPGPSIIVLTFVVCGFIMVYLLGTRTFCTYVCPYGAIFALADRFAPGRIRVTDACQQCGTCTAACTSGIRVHEEVKQHGMIVNSACLKDLDCVHACPHDALHYGFGRPLPLASFKGGGRFGRLRYDFSLPEELLAGVVFLVVLLTFRGLYGQIPFLLSLAFGAIIAYFAVTTTRLLTRTSVTLATLPLKRTGRLTRNGYSFFGFAVLLAAFVAHSAFVRYHEYRGLRGADRLSEASPTSVLAHLITADVWGLLPNERLERSALAVALRAERLEEARLFATRLLDRYPYDTAVRLGWGKALAAQDRRSEAEDQFRTIITQWAGAAEDPPPAVASAHRALGALLAGDHRYLAASQELRASVELDPGHASAQSELGEVLAELGRLDEAVAALREAVRLDPKLARAHYNLGTILAHTARFEEAIACYEQAVAGGLEDAEVLNNLGFALLRTGDLDRARRHLERAASLDPDNADVHFNLGVLFVSREQTELATEHYRIAARLDPRYARLLRSREGE